MAFQARHAHLYCWLICGSSERRARHEPGRRGALTHGQMPHLRARYHPPTHTRARAVCFFRTRQAWVGEDCVHLPTPAAAAHKGGSAPFLACLASLGQPRPAARRTCTLTRARAAATRVRSARASDAISPRSALHQHHHRMLALGCRVLLLLLAGARPGPRRLAAMELLVVPYALRTSGVAFSFVLEHLSITTCEAWEPVRSRSPPCACSTHGRLER